MSIKCLYWNSFCCTNRSHNWTFCRRCHTQQYISATSNWLRGTPHFHTPRCANLVLDKDKLFIKPLAWATGSWQPVLELISFDLCILEDIQDKGMGTNRLIQSIIAEPITESQPWFWNSRQNFHTGETLSTEMKWTMIQRNSSEIYNADFIYHPQSFLLPFFLFFILF